ncbi:ABC transporter ATP-binding protein [Petropleomorpha daqingensis]|uniref:Branched-chain amino acid transport system ATP-binding protein n=1 Tax=Petropleomorpha daqingensis TaxID=2026353 RepID=A0A853CRA4_9ACTN|nr:ABC transporter ATP-binding protein [Petropleomorpha daqingensis]NYJ08698.1 branched-chain amino acid transport system ATP-binding protein [Petropleomorpha daqingensis]
MPEPLLRVEALTAGYNRVPAVRDLSLELAPGEVVALLGPNGAGKTTSLLAMVGLVPLMSGSVNALGAAVDARRPHKLARRGVLLVPDDRGVFYGLSVRDHFRLASRRADAAREAAVLDRFPALRGLMGRKVGLCSGGEQQMLTIAKALLGRPKVLMIDEMSLGLAPKIVQEMLPSIRDLAKEEGIGVVLVEQHIELALSVADRGIILNHGRVVLEGAARDLLARRDQVEAAYFGAEEFADTAAEAGVPTH